MNSTSTCSNAPGRFYREGITLLEFFRKFPDDLAAEAWMEQRRWGDRPVCLHCGSVRVSRVKSRKPMPLRCKDCRKHFSVRYGTVMQSSKLGCQVWLLAIYLFVSGLKGTSSLKLHRDLGVTQKTAWHLAHRVRKALEQDDFISMFGGPVEADETYIGGLEKNKHKDKKMKAAGGPAGKAIVAGVKDRTTGQVAAYVVPNASAGVLTGIIGDHVRPGAQVYTDEWRGYSPLAMLGYDHSSVRHSVSEWVNGMAHTNGIESVWAILKRGYHGTFHHMSPEHLPRYVAEFVGRHNRRPLDTEDQLAVVFSNMSGKLLPYKQLVANGVLANRKAKMEML